MMNRFHAYAASFLAVMLLAGCTQDQNKTKTRPQILPVATQSSPRDLNVTPAAIPGTPRQSNHNSTGGYAPTNVQAQLRIDVKDGTKEVRVVRDNSDPFVITKPYVLKNADPFAVRSYLEASVGARSVDDSPAEATAVKFDDGTGVVLVSAEAYRFSDSKAGRGLDSIVASLDRKGLTFLNDSETYVYFPRASRAANLRDMISKVGSSELEPQFAVKPNDILVDAELNALILRAPRWSWKVMRKLLVRYDQPIPEIRISYRVLEIFAENDDRIGVDFQSWKNNDGVDLFSAGTVARRNWGTFFSSGVDNTGSNHTSYWNFNPKWNTRYLDFMTSIGKAKCLAQGELTAQNRTASNIQVNSGFFYDRTYYTEGATSIAEACTEFAYTDPNPNAIKRESVSKIFPYENLVSTMKDAGSTTQAFVPIGYTMRQMGTQVTTNTYGDANAKLGLTTDPLSKYLVGYVTSEGNGVVAAYDKTNWDTVNSAPGVIHGFLQYPMVTDGFKFDLKVIPVVTGKAAKINFDMSSISLLGWNSDGSARTAKSATSTTVQIGYGTHDFVIGGLRKSESVRSTSGLPFFKDLPVVGRAFSTESESIKQSQLVLIASVEFIRPDEALSARRRKEMEKVVQLVNRGMKSRVGNMFFQQYWLDEDREDRIERLDAVGKIITDEYQEIK